MNVPRNVNHRRRGVTQRRSGYTIREVLLVVVVIAVALLLFAPVLLQQRARSRRDACEHRQVATANAIFAFEGLHGQFPGYRVHQLTDEEEQAIALAQQRQS